MEPRRDPTRAGSASQVVSMHRTGGSVALFESQSFHHSAPPGSLALEGGDMVGIDSSFISASEQPIVLPVGLPIRGHRNALK